MAPEGSAIVYEAWNGPAMASIWSSIVYDASTTLAEASVASLATKTRETEG